MPDPRRDEISLTQLRRFLKHPKSIDQIVLKFGVSTRTAYRWMGYLEETGTQIVSRRKDKKTEFFCLT